MFRAFRRYVILQIMDEKDKPIRHPWLEVIKGRGWQNPTHLLLDVLEPMAALVGQMLWLVQPIAGIFGSSNELRDLAEILDKPDGIALLHQQLDDEIGTDGL